MKIEKVEQKEKNKGGRPSKYSVEIADKICQEIATTSKSLKRICKENDEFPSFVTVWAWLGQEDKPEFLNAYTRAKEQQADILADEIIEIADDGSNDTYTDGEGNEIINNDVLGRSKLRLDARKFIAAKLKPKKYGDKLDVTTKGESVNNLDLSHLTFEQLKELKYGKQ